MKPLQHLPLVIWLAACLAAVAWALSGTFHVGQMPLARAEAVILVLAILAVVNLASCWAWIGYRALARRLKLVRGPRAWVERPLARAVLLPLLPVCALLFGYAWQVEPRWVRVEEVRLGGAGPGAARARPVRMVAISDLHADGDGDRQPLSGLASTVNSARPDVVLLLGDLLSSEEALPGLRRTLRQMKAPHGKYAVRGNWEVWYWNHLRPLQGTGFSWLHRQRVTKRINGQTVHLVGQAFANPGTMGARGAAAEQMLAGLRHDSGWRVFLYHTPDLVEEVPSADLYLAGHTHGGQIAVPFYGALVTFSRHGKRFERGLYRVNDTHLYVTPGIGVEPAIPLRFGVRPEVTVIILGAKPGR